MVKIHKDDRGKKKYPYPEKKKNEFFLN